MAIYRNVQLSFWTDSKVSDDFTPEDKYFYLYLMTNPHTNLCGCYELSLTHASFETGYSKDSIIRLLDRMENFHQVIKYSKETKEVLIINWSKYNWTKSKDFQKPLIKEIESVKNIDFKAFLCNILKSFGTVITPSYDGVGTTDTVTDTDNIDILKDINNNILDINNTNTKDIKNNLEKENIKRKRSIDSETANQIIDYLNKVCGTKYRATTKSTVCHIQARLKEGFVLEEFKAVIDKKTAEWKGTNYEKYLRPETLFGTKFESYLNQKGNTVNQDNFDVDSFLRGRA